MRSTKINQIELVVIVLCALATNAFGGSPIWVTRTDDDSGPGSLRAAITQANEAGGGDIQFAVTGTITLQSPLPCLTNITLTGPGTNLLTVSGGNQFQVFCMNRGTTNTLSDLTIAEGATITHWVDEISGLRVPDEAVIIQRVDEIHGLEIPDEPVITRWFDGSGFLDAIEVGNTPGAGISNAGALKLLNCAIRGCTNWSYSDWVPGGGIYNAGDLLMKHCDVADCNSACHGAKAGGPGGGIANDGDLRMEDCTVSGCIGYVGAGIVNGIDYANANLLLTNCIIKSCINVDQGDGGGVLNSGNLTIHSCTVSNNYGFWGGGIESWGNCAITNSTIVDNRANTLGGGLGLAGTNVMVGCTVSRNKWALAGGGVCIYKSGSYKGVLSLFNCTVSENRASEGSGIYGEAYLNHCTIVSNTDYTGWGGGGVWGNVRSENSIFAGNGSYDISGVLISEGYNLVLNTNGCTITNLTVGNIYGLNPKLGPLGDYGGPTPTMPLLAGSPAIDAGPATGCLETDQRGRVRPYGAACDIGAFESSPPYVIRGDLSGFTLNEPVTLLTSPGSSVTATRGPYSIEGLTPDIYTITPSNANFHFVPSSHLVTVGSDLLGVNFKAYRWNALSLEGISNEVLRLTYAGTNGDMVRTLASSNLVDWRAISTNLVPATYLFDVFDTAAEPRCFYRTDFYAVGPVAELPVSALSSLTPPFGLSNGIIYQVIETDLPGSGRAVFEFTVGEAGSYLVRGRVQAANEGENSFFVNVGSEPTDPYMIWDIPVTSGFEERLVSWRGNGDVNHSEFVPKVFDLTPGTYELIIRGRERNTFLQQVTIWKLP